MIINGGSRSNGGFFGRHLLRMDHNARVAVIEMRGLAAQTIRDAFREMKAVASGTRCINYFYHANLNAREYEVLTNAQWNLAIDTLEHELGLDGQPRFVVEHEKDGRTHRHVIWSRIDADSMTTISDSLTYQKHERAARLLEQAFGHVPVDSVLVKDRKTKRPERNPKDWETLRTQKSQLDPRAIKAEITTLWQRADSGLAFAAALHEHGYILVRGDRRDFCIIDQAGNEHSLARRIVGVKAADIRERMTDVERERLPSVAEGRALARAAAKDREKPRPDPAPNAPAEFRDKSHSIGQAQAVPDMSMFLPDEPLRPTPDRPSRDKAATPRHAYPSDEADALRRIHEATAPFVNAIREYGKVTDIQRHDGLSWWQRGAIYLFQQAKDWVHGLREKAQDYWQEFVRSTRSDNSRDRDRDFDHDR